MLRLRNGEWLLVILALLVLSACRKDTPPVFSVICLGDGFGGADCSTSEGGRKYLKPSELKNFWMTTNTDMQNYSSWCYKVEVGVIKQAMEAKEAEIKGYPVEVVNGTP